MPGDRDRNMGFAFRTIRALSAFCGALVRLHDIREWIYMWIVFVRVTNNVFEYVYLQFYFKNVTGKINFSKKKNLVFLCTVPNY